MASPALIALKLRVEKGIGNSSRRAEILGHIEALEALLVANPNTDVAEPIAVIAMELEEQGSRWVPLLVLLFVAGATAAIIPYVDPATLQRETFLGFNIGLLVIAAGAGFLGSLVRLLNRVVNHEFSEMSKLTATFVTLLRPFAGAALGVFAAAVFATGGVITPIAELDGEIFSGIPKGEAFIFVIAFTAGLIDEYAFNLANRFVLLGKDPSSPAGPAHPRG